MPHARLTPTRGLAEYARLVLLPERLAANIPVLNLPWLDRQPRHFDKILC